MPHLLIETEDGSHSLISDQFQVSYHSRHGAVQESVHVFIKAGLEYVQKSKKSIHVLEMGFGTGLNALLTYIASKESQLDLTYHTIEASPISISLVQQLNYFDRFSDNVIREAFIKMHEAPSGKELILMPNFTFRKYLERLEEYETEMKFDVIYFDAFAPNAQPELWTEEIFAKLYRYLNTEGILVTYCAKGVVKRTLKSVGFEIESIPGPPGKREMTRAIKR